MSYYDDLNKIKKNPELIKYTKNPTTEMCVEAVRRNINLLPYVKTSDQFYIEIIKYYPEIFSNIQNLTYEFCIECVKQNCIILQYIPEKYHTYELCMDAVTHDGCCIIFSKNLDINICMTAMLNKKFYNKISLDKFVDVTKDEYSILCDNVLLDKIDDFESRLLYIPNIDIRQKCRELLYMRYNTTKNVRNVCKNHEKLKKKSNNKIFYLSHNIIS